MVDRQTPAEVAARYGVHRSWVDRLKARYEADGEAAFEARSRRPKTSPTAIPPATVALITELRGKLTTAGLDAGPDTIAWHLTHHHGTTVSASTISRTLTRAGLVTPQPHKRPRSSYVLLGASFGGLTAHIYAASYPKDVVGMVLLDTAFPDELDLERYFPKDERTTHDEWPQLLEQIDPLGVYEDGHALIGKEPAIPVTYLLAMPSTWSGHPPTRRSSWAASPSTSTATPPARSPRWNRTTTWRRPSPPGSSRS